jgi:signal transduction histidine kinase
MQFYADAVKCGKKDARRSPPAGGRPTVAVPSILRHDQISLTRARHHGDIGVRLRTDVNAAGVAESDESLLVLADEDRLLQVVSNLVENALR